MTLLLLGLLACDGPQPAGDDDLGPIEDALDEFALALWPGVVEGDGTRTVRLLNGFFGGAPTAYWFGGPVAKTPSNVFWFCREGDSGCPLDETGAVDRGRAVGLPVYQTIPGEDVYSPFWLIWVVTVPDDYVADTYKSVDSIEEAAADGRVSVERLIWDFPAVGPASAMMHCMLATADSALEGNGEDLVGQPGVASLEVPLQGAWYRGYLLHVFDFTEAEGVFPPDPASVSEEIMPSANLFMIYRDCAGGSTSPVCGVGGTEAGAVSERGTEQDLTGDGDKRDNNNLVSGIPGTSSPDSEDPVYSGLWKVQTSTVPIEHDADVALIDSTGDQDLTDVKSTQQLRELVDAGWLSEPEPLSEEAFGVSFLGNGGQVFFECPSQVAAP